MTAIFDAGPPPPCPAPFNMAAYVLAHADRLSVKIALAVLGAGNADRWSYARLAGAVRGTATGLREFGLTPGDRVLMRLGNTVDFPVVYLAAILSDLLPVPTSPQLTDSEVGAIAAELDPALIVAADGVVPPAGYPTLDVAALRALRDRPPAEPVMGAPDRPAYIVYTSGTSGRPRAVIHAHRAIWARRMMWQGWYGLAETDRMLHAGGFNWTYTLGTGLMDPWSIGATALIPAEGVDRAALALLLRRHDATIFAAAPGVYRQLLRVAPTLDLPRLRHGLSAGEKLPEATRAAWAETTGTPIFEAYGMSECSTFISGAPGRPAAPGTLGRPQPGRRVAIVDADGRPRAHDAPGIIAVSSRDPGLMLGYLDAEAATRARFRGEWFLTGDTATMASDGTLTYMGRDDDMMNAGGYRVSPLEVEAAMSDHPEIAEVAAAEVTVRADVTVIAAFYVADRDLPEVALAEHAAARLARYKCPRIFLRRDTLPRGANNKLLRHVLRDGYERTP